MTNKNMRNRDIYISGNNAIQLEGIYSDYKTERNKREKTVKPRPKEQFQGSNRVYTFILTSVIITTLVVTVVLLKTQFIVTDNAEKLIQLQQELVEIKETNNQLESDIQKNVNMDEIYKIATQELGMVQASKDNVKYVNSNDSTYTVQYADVNVPKDKVGVNVGNILGFISKGW